MTITDEILQALEPMDAKVRDMLPQWCAERLEALERMEASAEFAAADTLGRMRMTENLGGGPQWSGVLLSGADPVEYYRLEAVKRCNRAAAYVAALDVREVYARVELRNVFPRSRWAASYQLNVGGKRRLLSVELWTQEGNDYLAPEVRAWVRCK